MTQDNYAILGVAPSADAATIRAAYLALMRQYHPDRNASPAATLRAQAIIAAFKVLGDFDRRNHYDWDRRREREAAAALAAQRPRGKQAGVIAAGAVGLAAAAAWALLPAPSPKPGLTEPRAAEARQAPVAKARPAPQPKRVVARPPAKVEIEKRVPVAKAEPQSQPIRVAKVEPVRPKPKMVERPPVTRVAAVTTPTPRFVPTPPPLRPAKAVARPAQPPPKPATDLASLDQFVMNFYGQSWRYGDAPKRAALAQSRNRFVAKRGECAADECKRAAYLKLMRDVSEIVETGQPKTR